MIEITTIFPLHLLSIFLLLFPTAFNGIGGMKVHENVRVVSIQELQWGDQRISSYSQFSDLFKTSRKTKRATMLELKHHIPSSLKTLKFDPDFHENLLLADSFRVISLQSEIKSKAVGITLTSGVPLQTLNYVINIKIGNQNTSVIVDTGSDLTWVQCKPCTYCYSQHNPLYDPSNSTTYHMIPCNSTLCPSLPWAETRGNCGLGRSDACNYALRYGDGSYTRGELARERIYFGDIFVDEFVFGCGRSNRGLFGVTSGLLGLGRAQLSLVSQTKARFGGTFSYCLPSRVYDTSGNLVLGDDPTIYKNSTPVAYTRLLSGPQQVPYYFLNLTGVRVGGIELGLSKGVRILMDSGTVITRLVPSLYKAVRDAFSKQFSGYPKADAFSILDTCFDLSKYEQVNLPKLGLEFEGGVEMNVDATGILYFVKKDASQVCLAMASLTDEDGLGIIGNYQQKNHRIVYDNLGDRVGFGEENCSYS